MTHFFNLNRIFGVFSMVLFASFLYAQDISQLKDKANTPQQYLKFAPSNLSATHINPSDIPSEDVLRQMGLSDQEIKQAMDYKFQKGAYNSNFMDSSATDINQFQANRLVSTLSDTLFPYNDSIQYPIAKVYGQNFFRNQSINFFTRSYDSQAPTNYLIGEGDELTISIWGLAEHNEVVVVNDKGYIQSMHAGRIYVGNKDLKTVKSLVRGRLGNFFDLSKSQFDLTLNYSREITVNIIGEVFNPGSYSIPATNTAFNALVASGGPNQIGSVRHIYVIRDGETVDSLDVYKFLFDVSYSKDLFMQNNDKLFVNTASRLVEMKGEINRPYTYEVKPDDKLVDLIKYAGGFTKMAYKNGITVKRIEGNEVNTITIDEVGMRHFKMKNGDEIIVNSIQGIARNLVNIHSSVGVSGDYQFTNGERIYDMLLKSNSLNDDLFLNSAYLVRTDDNFDKEYIIIDIADVVADPTSASNILVKEYDELFFLSRRDFMDEYQVTISGGVRVPNTFSFGNGITLSDILTMAGGLVPEASGGKIDVSRVLELDDETNILKAQRELVRSFKITDEGLLSEKALDFELEPFDEIAVRINTDFEEVRTIYLTGEVEFPGKYSLISNKETLSELIERAGGIKYTGDAGAAKMYRMLQLEENPKNKVDYFEDDEEIINGFFSDGEFVQIVPVNEEDKSKVSTIETKYTNKYTPVHVDLRRALKYKKSKYNIVLNHSDSIHIPKFQDLVKITGALSNFDDHTISVPYMERRANYYVNNFAGGFNKHNVKANTLVISPSGAVKKAKDFGLFVLYPRVKSGSTIKVTEDIKIKRQKPDPVDWTRVLESTVTKISALASLYILYLSRQN